MKFGIYGINGGPCIDPRTAARVARAAELVGFDSLWGGEHVVLPDPRVPPSPGNPTDPVLDPVVTLTFVAAHTRTIRLGTGIIILPQRNPLVLAKELASLDVLSGGRLLFGVGVGYLEPEFRALGVPLADRGRRTDEYLGAMRAIWSQAQPAYQGRFVAFGGVQAYPRPLQQPAPWLVIGGHSPHAYRRAVEQGNGWYGYGLDVPTTERALAGLRQARQRYPRPPELGELEISVTPPPGHVDIDTARQFAALGVHRLILSPPRDTDADVFERFVTAAEPLLRRLGS